VRYELLDLEVTQRVLQLHGLNEEVVLGIKPGRGHRRLEVEAQPLLDTDAAQFRRTLGQVHKQNQIQNNRRGQDRVAAEEVELDLHRIAEPSEDVDVVPTLFVVATRRVVVDAA